VTTSVLVLGAGFGGLEFSTRLSAELGGDVEVSLIDRADAFAHEVGRVDVDFFSNPGHPVGAFEAPSAKMAAEKLAFASSRHARWFGA
jgi:hypothetical protein